MKKVIGICAFLLFMLLSTVQASAKYVCYCQGGWYLIIPLFNCGHGYTGGNFHEKKPDKNDFGFAGYLPASLLSSFLPEKERNRLINTGQPQYSPESGWKCEKYRK